MVDLQLYTLVLPAAGQADARPQQNQQLSKHGLLDSDAGNVEQVATEPGQQSISGRYAGQYAEKMATELEELASSGIGPLALGGLSEETPKAGYYEIEGLDSPPVNPQARNLYRYELRLAREGTRESKRRAVRTTIVQVDSPFGNSQTAYLGIPTQAGDVQWLDSESKQTESVSVVETRSAELGDVMVVDVQASSFTDPTLVYDITYTDEEDVDVRVWDTRGTSGKLDTDGDLQWMKVFATGHEFTGQPIFDNGLVRLQFDSAGNALSVEEWDDANSTWSSVALGTSSWEFDQYDVTRISPSRVEAQCRFIDPSQSPTAVYYLDMSLQRGYWWPQWTRTASSTSGVPSGLVDLLDPVANGSDYEPQSEQGLVDRKSVRS
jgi:hypothetical protein